MEAMVRMYDLTRDPRYLAHLRDLSRLVLDYRDDRRQDRVPSREDPFRGVVRVSVRDLLLAPGRQLVDGVSSGRGPHRPHRRAEGCG